jgi:hypothetical protein
MEVLLEVAWLVPTLRDWGLLHALHFSLSYHRGSHDGESFLVLSVETKNIFSNRNSLRFIIQ